MPRYFFHVKTTVKTIITDDEGMDLADLEAVREEATRAAREIVDDMISCGQTPPDRHYVAMNAAG